jgi:hypothetical protein
MWMMMHPQKQVVAAKYFENLFYDKKPRGLLLSSPLFYFIIHIVKIKASSN